jgi:hypothetical protein
MLMMLSAMRKRWLLGLLIGGRDIGGQKGICKFALNMVFELFAVGG